MHQQRQASPGNMRQGRSQLLLRHHGEAIDAGIDQKAFEPRHSSSRESFDVVLIIVDHSAPSRPIDAAPAFCGCTLSLKRSDRRSRGKAVQRHVDQQRIASRRRCACRCFEAFPLRTARIVDMHVGIDQPRKNGRVAEIMDFATVAQVFDRRETIAWMRSPSTRMAAGRIPSGVTTRRETKACKLKMSAPWIGPGGRAYSGTLLFYNARFTGIKQHFTKF